MSFVYQNYLFIVVGVIIVFSFLVIREENKFFAFVERFWFKKKSFIYSLSRLFFLLGFTLLALSILDLRGPEERIKAKVPSKRTVILIDTSASMLAEDVRPSRLEKAVLLAKHFARKAVGHQISVVVFSEIQKKIVPFTADLDLIDSRLESIRGLKNQYGTSALSTAIQEAIQIFSTTGEEPQGNILVLTDGEETVDGIDLKIPEGVYVAFVGIGTQNGGRIPLDDKRGMRYGYKHHKGKEVITKLDEDFFKGIVSKYPQTKYWTADTYALPSEEIVAFFEAEFSKGIENQDMVIRPVFMQWLVVPGIIFLLLSYFLKMVKVFAVVAIILINPVWAEEVQEKPIPEKIMHGLEQLQKGRLSREQKLGLAYELQKNQFNEEALKLYEEESEHLNHDQRFNYGTALLSNKKYQEGFSEYRRLLEDDNISDELKKKIAQNSLLFLQHQEQEKQQKKDEQNKQNDQNQEGSDEQSEQNSSGQSQDQNQNQSPSQSEQDGKDQQQNNENQDNEKKEDNKDDKNKDKPQDGEDDKPRNLPPKKLPAKLKQLMSDDRKLQMEMIERGTKDMNKRKSNSSKDW
ncbi:MAG: VWA domain-containing protein [Candidatus Caldatribacteriota bacterium]